MCTRRRRTRTPRRRRDAPTSRIGASKYAHAAATVPQRNRIGAQVFTKDEVATMNKSIDARASQFSVRSLMMMRARVWTALPILDAHSRMECMTWSPQERTGALRVGGDTPLAGDGRKGRQASTPCPDAAPARFPPGGRHAFSHLLSAFCSGPRWHARVGHPGRQSFQKGPRAPGAAPVLRGALREGLQVCAVLFVAARARCRAVWGDRIAPAASPQWLHIAAATSLLAVDERCGLYQRTHLGQ